MPQSQSAPPLDPQYPSAVAPATDSSGPDVRGHHAPGPPESLTAAPYSLEDVGLFVVKVDSHLSTEQVIQLRSRWEGEIGRKVAVLPRGVSLEVVREGGWVYAYEQPDPPPGLYEVDRRRDPAGCGRGGDGALGAPIALRLAEDRGLLVPPGHVVRSGYVLIHKVRLACRDRMAVGDVDRAYQRLLQCAPAQPWPPPIGTWDGDTFRLHDGRHAYVAALMLGYEHVLVAWLEEVG